MSEDKLLFKNGSKVLTVMMMSIIVVNFYILLAAFTHYTISNYRISKKYEFTQTNAQRAQKDSISQHQDKLNNKTLVSQSLSSNFENFVFTIFLAGLLSGGLFLLNFSHGEAKKIHQDTLRILRRARDIEPFIIASNSSRFLVTQFTFAFTLSSLIKENPNDVNHISKAREILHQIDYEVESKTKEIVYNDLKIYGSFLDYLRYIKQNLDGIEKAGDIARLTDKIAENIEILIKTDIIDADKKMVKTKRVEQIWKRINPKRAM